MFYDKVRIYVRAGKGGDGAATFRREKYVPFGGPDGGDGGKGGDIWIEVDPNLNTLLPFAYKKHFKAENGGRGGRQQRKGKDGADLVIKVPPGTVVRDVANPAVQVDLLRPGQRLLVAKGGRGGRGNVHFATPTHQAPRMYEKGEPGEERWLELELKLIADVGLVGFPNAGKSSILAAVTAARPKIAPYPFTTKEPILGVAAVGDYSFVVADIPGLIEGAHRGAGLGLEFLRHVQRTRLLVHVIDGDPPPGRDPISDYHSTNREMELYDPGLVAKPQYLALNKIDLAHVRERVPEVSKAFEALGLRLYPVSAVTREGLDVLFADVAAHLRQLGPRYTETATLDSFRLPPPGLNETGYQISRDPDGTFVVTGGEVDRIAAITDPENEEALRRLERWLEHHGVFRELRRRGIREGDTIRIGHVEFLWGPDLSPEEGA
jgi:GTP-binding protein